MDHRFSYTNSYNVRNNKSQNKTDNQTASSWQVRNDWRVHTSPHKRHIDDCVEIKQTNEIDEDTQQMFVIMF